LLLVVLAQVLAVLAAMGTILFLVQLQPPMVVVVEGQARQPLVVLVVVLITRLVQAHLGLLAKVMLAVDLYQQSHIHAAVAVVQVVLVELLLVSTRGLVALD